LLKAFREIVVEFKMSNTASVVVVVVVVIACCCSWTVNADEQQDDGMFNLLLRTGDEPRL
jgi:hypothetical protein